MQEVDIYTKVEQGYYNTKLTYHDPDFLLKVEEEIKALDKVKLTVKERKAEIEKIKLKVSEHNTNILAAYREDQDRLDSEFEKDVEEYFEFVDFPEAIKSRIHSHAYVEGHRGGFSDILSQYEDLVEFARICKQEFCK